MEIYQLETESIDKTRGDPLSIPVVAVAFAAVVASAACDCVRSCSAPKAGLRAAQSLGS